MEHIMILQTVSVITSLIIMTAGLLLLKKELKRYRASSCKECI